MSTNTEVEKVARRVREETTGFALGLLGNVASTLGMVVSLDDKVSSLTFKRGEEWVGPEENGRKCWVEHVSLTLECGCVALLESVGGTVTQSVGRQCREHRPALVMVLTPVPPLTDGDIQF